MTDCLGCNAVSGPANTLHDGAMVCATCPDWLLECEAREILRLGYRQGRERAAARLDELAQHRVAKGRAEALRSRVNAIKATLKANDPPNWLTREKAVAG
jgi:hypothetical protein